MAAKARKVTNVAEKAIAVSDAIAEKKKVSVILHKTADALHEAGTVSGNERIVEIAGHVKRGAKVVDKAVDHAKDVVKIARDTARATASGDVKGVVKQVQKGIKKQKELKKYRSELQAIISESKRKPTKRSLKAAEIAKELIKIKSKPKYQQKSTPKPRTQGKPKQPKQKSTPKPRTKGKRAPSKYNLFVKKWRTQGKSMKEIGAMWQSQKKN